MKLYCLCIDETNHRGQVYGAPNRVGPRTETETVVDSRPVLLQVPMQVFRMGVDQRVMNSSDDHVPPQDWLDTEEQATEDQMLLEGTRRHYPNVDILKCPHCGAKVVREG